MAPQKDLHFKTVILLSLPQLKQAHSSDLWFCLVHIKFLSPFIFFLLQMLQSNMAEMKPVIQRIKLYKYTSTYSRQGKKCPAKVCHGHQPQHYAILHVKHEEFQVKASFSFLQIFVPWVMWGKDKRYRILDDMVRPVSMHTRVNSSVLDWQAKNVLCINRTCNYFFYFPKFFILKKLSTPHKLLIIFSQ